MVKRNIYSNELKLKVVLESFQRDTTIEKVRQQFNVHTSVVNRWRKQFRQYAAKIFEISKTNKNRTSQPEQTVEELKQIIGELTCENVLLKKALERLA